METVIQPSHNIIWQMMGVDNIIMVFINNIEVHFDCYYLLFLDTNGSQTILVLFLFLYLKLTTAANNKYKNLTEDEVC